MAYYFTCKRCEYFTKYKIDMKRHYEKQKKCKLKDDNSNYTDAEFYELSLVKNEYSPNDLIAMNNKAIIEDTITVASNSSDYNDYKDSSNKNQLYLMGLLQNQ